MKSCTIILSKTLVRTGVIDIGRKSECWVGYRANPGLFPLAWYRRGGKQQVEELGNGGTKDRCGHSKEP